MRHCYDFVSHIVRDSYIQFITRSKNRPALLLGEMRHCYDFVSDIFYIWSYILYIVIYSIYGHKFYKWSYILYVVSVFYTWSYILYMVIYSINGHTFYIWSAMMRYDFVSNILYIWFVMHIKNHLALLPGEVRYDFDFVSHIVRDSYIQFITHSKNHLALLLGEMRCDFVSLIVRDSYIQFVTHSKKITLRCCSERWSFVLRNFQPPTTLRNKIIKS